MRIDGAKVTVDLHVFAGIDVDVTLDAKLPDLISGPVPVLTHVFTNVAPGMRVVMVSDVVGFTQTREVLVPPTDEMPER